MAAVLAAARSFFGRTIWASAAPTLPMVSVPIRAMPMRARAAAGAPFDRDVGKPPKKGAAARGRTLLPGRRHARAAAGLRPFVCKGWGACCDTFTKRQHLKRHIESIHKGASRRRGGAWRRV